MSFVNMIGTDAESLKKAAAEFVAKHGIKRVAFVVPEDAKDGPENFKIAPDADLTVVCYKEGKVKANHAFAEGRPLRREDRRHRRRRRARWRIKRTTAAGPTSDTMNDRRPGERSPGRSRCPAS